MKKYFGKNYGFSSLVVVLLLVSWTACSNGDEKADYDRAYFVGDWDVDVNYTRISDGGQGLSDTLLNAAYVTGVRFYSRGRDYGEGEILGGIFPGQHVEWSYNEINEKFLYSELLIGSRDLYEVWLMDVLYCEDNEFQVREVKEYNMGDTLVTQCFSQLYKRRI